jgi:hypothetical protein
MEIIKGIAIKHSVHSSHPDFRFTCNSMVHLISGIWYIIAPVGHRGMMTCRGMQAWPAAGKEIELMCHAF